MNYTKYFRPSNISHDKFKFEINDQKMQLSVNILRDIKKTNYIIKNYNKFDNKFDLDEYFALFLQDKNCFINDFKEYIEKSDEKKVSLLIKKNFVSVLEILKNEMDNLLKEYKITKQTILKKLKNIENYWKEKMIYIKTFDSESNKKIFQNLPSINNITNLFKSIPNPITDFAGNFSSTIKNSLSYQLNIPEVNIECKSQDKSKIQNEKFEIKEKNSKNQIDSIAKLIEMKNLKELSPSKTSNYENNDNSYNPYEDPSNSITMIKKNDSTDLDKTKNILFELSDLMTNFSLKVYEQHEMTKEIINLSNQSVDNIQNANKQLVIAQDYQKGRGLLIGLVFMILGFFLIFYDYTL